MARVLVVPGGVLAGGVVAAADVAAGLAHPQMDPPPSGRQALLAALNRAREIEIGDRVEMGAFDRRRGRRYTR
jgi:hypothetical protein